MTEKNWEFERAWEAALVAGKKALDETVPVPMGVYSAGLMGEQLGPVEIVEEGECGGAYLTIDGREPFKKFLQENHPEVISKNYPKGFCISTDGATSHYRGQSALRYENCAIAMKEVLQENGIRVGVRAYLT